MTVPSCAACNSGASADDEYFRFIVATGTESADEPAAKPLLDTIKRSLQRPEGQGFVYGIQKATALESTSAHDVPQPMFHIDLPRVKRVSNRITRAFFYIQSGKRLPDNYEIQTFINGEHEFFFSAPIAKVFAHHLADAPAHKIGDGEIFGYQCAFPEPADAGVSLWHFSYLNSFYILSLTRKRKSGTHSKVPPGALVLVPCGER